MLLFHSEEESQVKRQHKKPAIMLDMNRLYNYITDVVTNYGHGETTAVDYFLRTPIKYSEDFQKNKFAIN